MPVRGGGFLQGYNAQAVRSRDGLCLAASVTAGTTDYASFEPLLRQAQESAVLLREHARGPRQRRRRPGRAAWDDLSMSTADRYRKFSTHEAHRESPCFEEWAAGVAGDPELLGLLDALPFAKRQPNLLFAAARYAGLRPGPYDSFRAGVLAAWPQVSAVIMARRTQTNEVARSGLLLPLLAALPQPLALLEVGASAGLCLYPDKYSYQYGDQARIDPPGGPGATVISVDIDGPVPVPAAVPEVRWRAGIDLNPLDVNDPEDVRWLETLIWPEQEERRQRLAAAVGVARADPPRLVAGDLNDKIAEVAAQAPRDATLVIFHTAVLVYLDAAGRAQFAATVRDLPGAWIANEDPGVLTFEPGALPPSPDPDRSLDILALDGRPVAYAAPHGGYLHWLG
jgi:hypothetical protein